MAEPNLIVLKNPRSEAAEAFRTLRTNLMFSSQEKPITTLLVTSASTANDKSLALANLAVTFAQSGNRTILVDSDLRMPSQHSLFGVGNERGLTTMITEDSAISNPPLIETGIENLQLLTAGPATAAPADVLSNRRMDEIIGVLKARASYILFDAPPVLVASDAALLGSKLDGVLLVVQAGSTRRDHVARAQEALERVHVRVIGAALLNAPSEGARRYNYR
jgi:non-specific protein-tyrosine kinase